jgi:acetyl-CoA carboxylase biotin carboxylase subunit
MLENPELRTRMGEAAVRVARAAGYANAGTMEFLVDRDRNFYFLEMNTRLQVEHPVTELVTGLDLVEWQLRIAAGEPLTLHQQDIAWRGSAIECRIYAEDPRNEFLPSPGRITYLREPSGPGIRVDSGVYEGWNVPLDYDPLLAKLIAWAPSRESAIHRLDRALAEYAVGGIRTNTSFFRQLLADPDFRAGRLSTDFLATHDLSFLPEADLEAEAAAAIALAIQQQPEARKAVEATSRWLAKGRESLLQ